MNFSEERISEKRVPWFQEWFDTRYYYELYSYRDSSEASIFIDSIIGHMQPSPCSFIIDVGCGEGRHAKYLAAKKFNVTGLDLSQASIQKAKQAESERLHFFRHDMRIPFGKSQYDFVFNFFTSFGYFEKMSDNENVIRNMSNALRRGGTLLLDYVNVFPAEKNIIPYEVRSINEIIYHISRWIDDDFFYKEIIVDDVQGNKTSIYTERVAKLNVEDFNQMFVEAGLELKETFGDYKLNTYDYYCSPRLIMIAEKL